MAYVTISQSGNRAKLNPEAATTRVQQQIGKADAIQISALRNGRVSILEGSQVLNDEILPNLGEA